LTLKRLGTVFALAATLSLATQTLDPGAVEAQCGSRECEQIGGGIKGKIGLGLIGAELGFVIPALAGMEDTWAYIVFPIVGAAGGAVAGHFLIDQNFGPGEGEVPVAILAAGMALVVPTMVLTLALTAYDPGDEGVDAGDDGDGPDADAEGDVSFDDGFSIGGSGSADPGGGDAEPEAAPAEAPPGPGASRRDTRLRNLARAGGGMFRLSEEGLLLGVPGVGIAPSALTDATEVHVPLFTGVF
jgi:hypothetical protein